MQFKNLSIFALTSGALAAAVPRQVDPALQQVQYQVMVLRSGSPVHYQMVKAVAGGFFVGKTNTTSYCPPDVEAKGGCPAGNETVFKDSCSMSSENPQYYGWPEQVVWNTPEGMLGYQNSQLRPDDARNCPWYLATSDNDAFVGTLTSTSGGNGFLACPTGEEDVWEIVRQNADGGKTYSPQGDISQCLGVSLEATKWPADKYGAYVYT